MLEWALRRRRRDLAEPLAVMQLAMRSPGEAKAHFPGYRLSDLVASRLQLDDLDMASFSEILELDPVNPSIEQSKAVRLPAPARHYAL